MQVALQHLVGDRQNFVPVKARVNLEIAHRAEQPVDVLGELEGLVPDSACGIEDRLAELESAVAERDEHPALGLDLAVVVCNPLIGALSHDLRLPACVPVMKEYRSDWHCVQPAAPLASSCTAKNDARTGCSGSSMTASESRARRVARPRTIMPSFRFGMGLRAMGTASAAL